MKKQITITILGIIMLAGAMAMYSGESITFETNLTAPVYTVLDNSSNLEGLTVEFANGNITLTSDPLMKSDNFTIIFFDEITKEVVKTIHSGHTRTKIRYVDNNVTVYVPEYINTVEEIEKVINNTIVEEVIIHNDFKLWHIILVILFISIMVIYYKSKQIIKEEDNEK